MTDTRWAELVERAEGGPVTRGTMFGSKGLRTGRKFFAIWWHEQLLDDPIGRDALLTEARAHVEAQPQ